MKRRAFIRTALGGAVGAAGIAAVVTKPPTRPSTPIPATDSIPRMCDLNKPILQGLDQTSTFQRHKLGYDVTAKDGSKYQYAMYHNGYGWVQIRRPNHEQI